ncbi:hypothetical protein SAMN05421771_3609 [Granulicella pectinivorans]|uniref:Uncharacterized protein n=1 Tax=Granulicella pectinivorans TaxID=474950 RepID=A0A1I6MTJ7_9BACT|nr:hypothetical protein SAMN05421771_3609 [Granulicella pectinivorans]
MRLPGEDTRKRSLRRRRSIAFSTGGETTGSQRPCIQTRKRSSMKTSTSFLLLAPLAFTLAASGQNPAQTQTTPPAARDSAAAPSQTLPSNLPAPSEGRSAGGDIGSGSGDIGKGAGKGAGKAAEGVGKGAGDLVTLHPLGAAENVGKGVGEAGKDVGVGTVKGTGKIAKGTGRLIAKPFHHSKKQASKDAPAPQEESPHA